MRQRLMVKTILDAQIAELAGKTDDKRLDIRAVDCAERVLHYFEEKRPEGNRPGKATGSLRTSNRTSLIVANCMAGRRPANNT